MFRLDVGGPNSLQGQYKYMQSRPMSAARGDLMRFVWSKGSEAGSPYPIAGSDAIFGRHPTSTNFISSNIHEHLNLTSIKSEITDKKNSRLDCVGQNGKLS